MKDTKKNKDVVLKEDGSAYNPATGQSFTEEGLRRYRDYQNSYIKKAYRTFIFRVRKDSEASLIQFCEEQENLAQMLLTLIKEEMMREGKAPADCFGTDENKSMTARIILYLPEGKEQIAEYIEPFLEKMPKLSTEYYCEYLFTEDNRLEFSLQYKSNYSLNGIASQMAGDVEAYLKKACVKTLVQFGFNPAKDIFNRKFTIGDQN